MNSTIAQTLPQNQTLQGYVAYNRSYGQFCDFWPILVKIWLPQQRPLDPCNQKCLLWIGRPRKPPVISNHILAIFHKNAFICIYSNFSPKIDCCGNALLSLVQGSVTREFPDNTSYLKTKLCMGMLHTIEVTAIFDFLAYFGQNLVAMATSLRPLQSEMSSFDWSTTKTPVISYHILAVSRRNPFICIYSNFSPKIGCRGSAPLSLVQGTVTDEFPDSTNPISRPNSAWICIQLKI